MINARWEDPEVVAEFAKRETDHRLLALTEENPRPSELRVLDLGCAAGRNTIYLSSIGYEVHAVDLAEPMIRATRERPLA